MPTSDTIQPALSGPLAVRATGHPWRLPHSERTRTGLGRLSSVSSPAGSVQRESRVREVRGVCQNPAMAPARIILRGATSDDDAFVVEMARHACVIEDRPLPDSDDDEVLEMLPPAGVVPIIAEDHSGTPLGAVWTYYGSPPLRCDAAGAPLPELCIGVAPGRRGAGVGGLLLDASSLPSRKTTTRCAPTFTCATPPSASMSAKVFAVPGKAMVR